MIFFSIHECPNLNQSIKERYSRMLPCEKTTIFETVNFVPIHRGNDLKAAKRGLVPQ